MKLARQHRTAPVDTNPADVIRGLETFIADLQAGHPLAVASIAANGEMPLGAKEWAAYATDPTRLELLAEMQQAPTA